MNVDLKPSDACHSLIAKSTYGYSWPQNEYFYSAHSSQPFHSIYYNLTRSGCTSIYSHLLHEDPKITKSIHQKKSTRRNTRNVGRTWFQSDCHPQLNPIPYGELTKTNLNTSCSLALIVIGTDQLRLYYTNEMDNLVLLPCHFNGPLTVPAPASH